MPTSDSAQRHSALWSLGIQAVLFCLPVLAIWAMLEAWMFRVPNSYAFKDFRLRALAGELDTLILGSSAAYSDICPTNLTGSAFNLAEAKQSPYYDYRLVAEVLPLLPKLKRIIITVNYGTFFMQMASDEDGGRAYFYEQAWHIPPEKIRDWCNIRMWSRVTLRTPRVAISSLLSALRARCFGRPNATRQIMLPFDMGRLDVARVPGSLLPRLSDPDVDDRGWLCPGDAMSAPPDVGVPAAQAMLAVHNGLMKMSYETTSRDYLARLISILQQRNVEPIFVVLPVWRDYEDRMQPDYWNHTQADVRQLSDQYHVRSFSFLRVPDLAAVDFKDVDHLNPRGAVRFTRMLNAALEQPRLQ